jgi:hypothetical protein
MSETKSVLIELPKLPSAEIIFGVGAADFLSINELDSDD